jgi:microcin C transport system substrate-binding protein
VVRRVRKARWIGLLLALFALGAPQAGWSQAKPGVTRMNGMALVGEPSLPPDFKHFPYVNPDAPKGGEVSTAAIGSFDSFNPFIVRGSPAAASARVFESLLARSSDEPESAYAHIAAAIEVPDDHNSVTFEIRPEARFQDGHPIRSDDVVWTFNTLRAQGRPFYRQYYADVDSVVADDPLRVTFKFKTNQNRELAQILGEMPILPKHWWEGRDFTKPLTEIPLGSGPYRIARFEMGRTIVLERVRDYWGAKLPTALGLANFDTIRTEYYRDATVALEAFKAGQVDWRIENSAKNWATAYDFPAMDKKLVKKDSIPVHLPTGMQGFAMNTRRAVFADPRVRAAIAEVFDFEWMNKNLFYDSYTRTSSYFSNSDFASTGLPDGDELKILEKYRDKLPKEVFTKPFKLSVTDGSGNNRAGLRRALDMLAPAGWKIVDRNLVNAAGQRLSFEILLADPSMERIALPYKQRLEQLGVDVRVRTVDPAQYQRLMDSFDFDMTVDTIGQSSSPGNEQMEFWSCAASKSEGSENKMGICDPVVDALVADILAAHDRASLIAATRALDRVLLAGNYIVPHWHLARVWIAYWDRFGQPPPSKSGPVINAWWIDPARAAVVDPARRMGQ